MSNLPLIFPTGQPAEMADAQREGLLRAAKAQGISEATHKYLVVHKELAGPAMLFQANGMWIGVEPDGHAHT